MPLCNRVDPFGDIRADPARGLFTGNRGVIHDPEAKTLTGRRWTTRTWLICRCDFRGRRREVMGRNAPSGGAGWTELFFLDEVTALAAGHRPCFFCRRERAADFLRRFAAASGLEKPKAADLDRRLHGERRASGGEPPPVTQGDLPSLPDGAVIAQGEAAWAKRGGFLHRWHFTGYGEPRRVSGFVEALRLLTPPTTLGVLRQGYRPAWHPSIER